MRNLWEATALPKSIRPEGARRTSSLPDRCDRNWFIRSFCPGEKIDANAECCPPIKFFTAQSPLALLAALPELFEGLTNSTFVTVRTIRHKVVGLSLDKPGITDPTPVITLIMQLLLKGARLNASEFNLTSPPPIKMGNKEWVYDESEEALEWLLPKELRNEDPDNEMKNPNELKSRSTQSQVPALRGGQSAWGGLRHLGTKGIRSRTSTLESGGGIMSEIRKLR